MKAAWLALAILFGSCQKELEDPPTEASPGLPQTETPPTEPPTKPPIVLSESKLVGSVNNFAYRLFAELRTGQQSQNLFFSPLSISAALTMVFNGASGTTKEAMGQTLGFGSQTDEEINESFKDLQQLLADLDQQVAFTAANAIWYDQRYELQAPFVLLNKTFFDATVQGLDFKDPDTKKAINDWVKAKTQGKIESIVQEIRPDHVMFLVNAIYFKATWTYPFDKGMTRRSTFYQEDGSTSSVNFMTMYNGKYLYYEDAGIKLIDLPYGQGQFSMTFLVSNDQNTVGDISAALNSTQLATWLSKADTSRMRLRMPRFTIAYQKELRPSLTRMGMGEAFTEQADLSRMLAETADRLFVSEVMHKTFVVVNEEGTEAAAVTGAATVPSSDPPTIKIDRPFVFLIREKSSNAIIFLGQLMKP
jgi:serine protease inhibitor